MSRESQTLTNEIRAYHQRLDVGTRSIWGIDGSMYRALDRVFNILTLGFTIYLIEYAEVEPILGMAFALLMVGGAEAVERFLVIAGDEKMSEALNDSDD